MNDFPYPKIQSFERLQVSDGLMINSERWRLAHEYHHQRQNVQFQSLFLPGIICGLGVVPIEAPADLPAKFRDGRWVQIQAGIAIDFNGNFIVVPTPLDFRISTSAFEQEIETVYLVLSYVDPNKLKRSNANEVIVETFRVNEKSTSLADTDIEICRIAIAQETLEIKKPADLFTPTISELDLRYRLQAKLRPQNTIHFACFSAGANSVAETKQNFKFLGQALTSLAPSLGMIEPIPELNIQSEFTTDQILPYHLIYLHSSHVNALNETTQLSLREYVANGGSILLEIPIQATKLEDLLAIQSELQNAKAKLKKNLPPQITPRFTDASEPSLHSELQEELDAIAIEIRSQTDELLNSLKSNLPIESPLLNFVELERSHPLRSQPFLFSSLPIILEYPIQILAGDGIIAVFGSLSSLFGGMIDAQAISREDIRDFQELGINILNYATQRYAMSRAMQINPQSRSDLTPPSDQRRTTNMLL
jgi:hypothetical protein